MSWLSVAWKSVKKALGSPTDAELGFWLYAQTLSATQRMQLKTRLNAVQFAITKAGELTPNDPRLAVAQEWLDGGINILGSLD